MDDYNMRSASPPSPGVVAVHMSPPNLEYRFQMPIASMAQIPVPDTSLGYWTEEEVANLKLAVDTVSAATGADSVDWLHVASLVPSRSAKQCRQKWLNHLREGISKDPWSLQEEYVLAVMHSKIGNKWQVIAKYLPRRPENTVKNHWSATARAKGAARMRTLLWLYADLVIHKNVSHAPEVFQQACLAYCQLQDVPPISAFAVREDHFIMGPGKGLAGLASGMAAPMGVSSRIPSEARARRRSVNAAHKNSLSQRPSHSSFDASAMTGIDDDDGYSDGSGSMLGDVSAPCCGSRMPGPRFSGYLPRQAGSMDALNPDIASSWMSHTSLAMGGPEVLADGVGTAMHPGLASLLQQRCSMDMPLKMETEQLVGCQVQGMSGPQLLLPDSWLAAAGGGNNRHDVVTEAPVEPPQLHRPLVVLSDAVVLAGDRPVGSKKDGQGAGSSGLQFQAKHGDQKQQQQQQLGRERRKPRRFREEDTLRHRTVSRRASEADAQDQDVGMAEVNMLLALADAADILLTEGDGSSFDHVGGQHTAQAEGLASRRQRSSGGVNSSRSSGGCAPPGGYVHKPVQSGGQPRLVSRRKASLPPTSRPRKVSCTGGCAVAKLAAEAAVAATMALEDSSPQPNQDALWQQLAQQISGRDDTAGIHTRGSRPGCSSSISDEAVLDPELPGSTANHPNRLHRDSSGSGARYVEETQHAAGSTGTVSPSCYTYDMGAAPALDTEQQRSGGGAGPAAAGPASGNIEESVVDTLSKLATDPSLTGSERLQLISSYMKAVQSFVRIST